MIFFLFIFMYHRNIDLNSTCFSLTNRVSSPSLSYIIKKLQISSLSDKKTLKIIDKISRFSLVLNPPPHRLLHILPSTLDVLLIYGIYLLQNKLQHNLSEVSLCEKAKSTSWPKSKLEYKLTCSWRFFFFDFDNIYIIRYFLSYPILLFLTEPYFYISFEI